MLKSPPEAERRRRVDACIADAVAGKIFDVTALNDEELAGIALEAAKRRFVYLKHHVAAVLDCNGTAYLGLHLDSAGHDICSEASALSRAVISDASVVPTRVVAAFYDKEKERSGILPPCGDCRQLLSQFAPHMSVILQNANGEFERHSIGSLLPFPYEGISR